MTDGERLQKFDADFARLKLNREKVPLEQLQTRWERPYNTLVAEVMDGAVWFHRKYLEALAFPTYQQDEAGNKWLADRIAAIEADEKKPEGLLKKFETALIEHLDMDEYENLVYLSYERRLKEAFDPYWRRHCKRLESGWIYNRIFKKFWWPKTEGYPESGCWINQDYSGKDYRFPPQLKEESP